MSMSMPPPEENPQSASSVDADPTFVAEIVRETTAIEDHDAEPEIEKETTAIEDHVAEPDWKITIENTDGSTSEVNLRQKQIRISMIAEKPKTKQPEISVSPMTEIETTVSASEAEKVDPSREGLKKIANYGIALTSQPQRIDPRKQRIWVIGQHVLTASSSIIIIAIMGVSLVAFHKNANVDGAFPKNTLLSPTIVMLSIACLNVAADIATLGIHLCHGKTAASAERMAKRIRTVLTVIQAIGGATSAGYFKSAQSLSGGADIWGFCCSDAATVNFAGMLCSINSAAWVLNILQVALHVLSFAIAIWTFLKPGQDLKTGIEEAKHLLSQDDMEDKKDVK